ncbi:MAG: hypothetical protein U1F63_05630 [Chitinivorax sp.]
MNRLLNRFIVFADFFQFVLIDELSDEDLSGVNWNDESMRNMLLPGEGIVCFGTLRNVDVPIEIHVVESPPEIDWEKFDHAVEASINFSSGCVAVMGCADYLPDAAKLEITPGSYRLLYMISGSDSINNEWEPADDLYSVYLWPSEFRPIKLIKAFKW